MSDHGVRWGAFRETFVGGHEDRLPFIYLRIPKQHEEYDKITRALKINENRLTSHYDLHETLRDVLIRSGGKMNSSSGCPGCQSLFEIVPMERSCEDAGISSQWCTCTTTKMIDQDDKIIGESGSKIFLDYVESVIKEFKNENNERLCSQLQLKKIHQIDEIIDMNNNNTKIMNKKYSYRIEVTPGGGMFEFLIYSNANGNFTMHANEIIRINSYAKDSKCLENNFRKFCFCLINITKN
ncbi:hypothetical protein PV327_001557 [Microctonus hyperodae]|uniref:Uncharacterized protein n=1 Tax=Microctonus hyperodae TaxID=165561 RepID=A0AA39L3C2_MICHY|nr:hypothetical protein PV327_001557 [Microctonus hyperodae]